jgi:hypothetical protein
MSKKCAFFVFFFALWPKKVGNGRKTAQNPSKIASKWIQIRREKHFFMLNQGGSRFEVHFYTFLPIWSYIIDNMILICILSFLACFRHPCALKAHRV